MTKNSKNGLNACIILQGRALQESGWTPRWFAKENGNNTYRYVGSYWEARKKMSWESCPVIFGQLPADQNSS